MLNSESFFKALEARPYRKVSPELRSRVWKAVCDFIVENLACGRSVHLKNFGTFGYTEEKLNIGLLGFKITRKPTLVLSERLIRECGFYHQKHTLFLGAPCVDVNYFVIARLAQGKKETCRLIMLSVVSGIIDTFRKGKGLNLSFPGLGRFKCTGRRHWTSFLFNSAISKRLVLQSGLAGTALPRPQSARPASRNEIPAPAPRRPSSARAAPIYASTESPAPHELPIERIFSKPEEAPVVKPKSPKVIPAPVESKSKVLHRPGFVPQAVLQASWEQQLAAREERRSKARHSDLLRARLNAEEAAAREALEQQKKKKLREKAIQFADFNRKRIAAHAARAKRESGNGSIGVFDRHKQPSRFSQDTAANREALRLQIQARQTAEKEKQAKLIESARRAEARDALLAREARKAELEARSKMLRKVREDLEKQIAGHAEPIPAHYDYGSFSVGQDHSSEKAARKKTATELADAMKKDMAAREQEENAKKLAESTFTASELQSIQSSLQAERERLKKMKVEKQLAVRLGLEEQIHNHRSPIPRHYSFDAGNGMFGDRERERAEEEQAKKKRELEVALEQERRAVEAACDERAAHEAEMIATRIRYEAEGKKYAAESERERLQKFADAARMRKIWEDQAEQRRRRKAAEQAVPDFAEDNVFNKFPAYTFDS